MVQNPAPNPAAPAFRIVPEPILRIGGLNDDERYELLGVVDAELTSSGGLIVAPYVQARVGWATELRVFDAAGKFVRRFGRAGQGPGEYTAISRFVLLPRDSVLIVDTQGRRITLVDAAGAVAATSSFPANATATCCFADGRYLTAPMVRPAMNETQPTERPKIPYTLASMRAQGTSDTPILTLDGSDPSLRIGPFERTINGRSTRSYNAPGLPFGRGAFIGVTAREIVYAINDSYEYRVYSPAGSLLRTVRAAVPSRPVTKQDLDERLAGLMRVATTPEMKAGFEKVLGATEFPKTHPAYSTVELEPDGSVWIRDYLPYGAPASDASWARFDPSGKLLGTLRLPPGTGLVRFSRGHALLSRRDADTETTYLSVHRIEPVR
jgi:hypothetical protein